MSKNKIQATFMNIGASSLLVIFLILCIAIFATLSLSSAKHDYSFSEDMAQHKTDYYSASNQSERMLDRIDALLADAAAGTSGQQAFYREAEEAIGNEILGIPVEVHADSDTDRNGTADAPSDDNRTSVSWQIPIDDTQALHVELSFHLPSVDAKGYYTIEKWQTAANQ